MTTKGEKKVEKALFNIFELWCRDELNTAQLIIRLRKIRTFTEKSGLFEKNSD